MGSCSSRSAQRKCSANTLEERLLSSERQASNMERMQECLCSESCSSQLGQRKLSANTLDEGLLSSEAQASNMEILQECLSSWRYRGETVNNHIEKSDYNSFSLFDMEFLAMTEQFPNVLGQISLPETTKPFEFHLKIAREFSSLCLTAKDPLSSGYFNKIPMVVNEKILTYLTGQCVLHTRVVWISMRSELNTYDRAYIKEASTARAEASFLDRVAMNLFKQLNYRVKQKQITEEDQSFEKWLLNYVETEKQKLQDFSMLEE